MNTFAERTDARTALRDRASRPPASPSDAALFLAVVGVPLFFIPASVAPFADPKLFLVAIAATLGVASAAPARALVIPVAAFIGAVVLATFLGVDPAWSLWGSENQSVGAIALVSAAALLLTGSGAPRTSLDRVPAWMLGTAAGVSVAGAALLLVPKGAAGLVPGAATLGQPVLLGGYAAAATVAASALEPKRWHPAALVAVGTGISVSGNRSAMLAVAAGAVVASRDPRIGVRRIVRVVAPVAAALVLWTGIDMLTPAQLSPVTMLRELDDGAASSIAGEQGSARARPVVWGVYLRAFIDDPVLGTGPATGWGAFLGEATAPEVAAVGRGWGDAHNLPVELLTTTGLLGAAAGLWIVAVVVGGRRRRAGGPAWAAGTATVLAVHHLLQPASVSLLPLLALSAGAVAWRAGGRARAPRPVLACAAIVLVVLAGGRMVASSLESYGRTYASEAALRAAAVAQPGRLSAAESLARHLALDGRARDARAAGRARELTNRMVARHAWNPGVRLVAADVALLLDDPAGAREWVGQHLARFPNDPVALAGAAELARRAGDGAAAASFRARAVGIDAARGGQPR